jgi:two-component system, NtrC family, sensor kinase
VTAAVHRAPLVLKQPRQIIAMLRLLVLAGLAMLGLSAHPWNPFLYWFVTGVYGLTNIGYLWARNRDFHRTRIKWLIFLFDVGMVSALILLRGEQVPSFMAAYFGIVLMAAIVDGLGNALLNAVLVSVIYGVISHLGLRAHELLTFGNLSQFVFFFVIAIFMGHLAEEAKSEAAERRAAQEALQSTSTELKQSTEQLKAAREALRANDRLATLGTFSAGIAHELKNALAAILNGLEPAPAILQELQMALDERTDGHALLDEMRDIVDDCRLACHHLERVAGDLTAVARRGTSEPLPIDAAEALDGAARMLKTRARDQHVELVTEPAVTRPVLADAGRLMQVLLNLGGNALDAMAPHGEGRLLLRAEDAEGDAIAFIVEDTGPGISRDVSRRMFEPFFTTKGPGKGTGLGLHLVSEIVKAQRGTLEYETAPGEGTRFRVRLPAAPGDIHPEIEDASREEDRADRGRRGDDPQGAAAHVASRAL